MRGGQRRGVRPGPRTKAVWAGYVACGLAQGHAAVSFYWAAGGTMGLSTLGSGLEEMGETASPALAAVAWGAGIAKVLTGLLALALVRPWGRVFSRWMMLAAGWGGASVLTLYGGVKMVVQALVVGGAIVPSGPVNWPALRWHLFLWDPWFLLWGVLLGVAAWHYTRESSAGGSGGKKARRIGATGGSFVWFGNLGG